MRGGLQGRYELRLGYTEIPKYRGYGTQTVFQGVGSGMLNLPGNWVNSALTSGMSTLDQSLTDTPLKTTRKTLDAGLTLKFAGRWSYRLDFEQQKNGGMIPEVFANAGKLLNWLDSEFLEMFAGANA